jgi:hypothetical protein
MSIPNLMHDTGLLGLNTTVVNTPLGMAGRP